MSRSRFPKLHHVDLRPIVEPVLWFVQPECLYRRLPDHCEVCGGKRGGVRGNENILDTGGREL